MSKTTISPLQSQLAGLTAPFALAMLLFVWSPELSVAQVESQKTPVVHSNYRLGPFDRLRLRIVTWRQSQAEVFEWAAINGEYTIDVDGKIAIPLVGEILATDTTTGELADRIAKRLQSKTNLAQKPDASVEIVTFRPFYIVGDVANSGEFPYRPGMTVIQAMTIAGGLPRSHALDVRQIERDIVGWAGELKELADEQTLLHAQIEQQQKLLVLAQEDKHKVESQQRTGIATDVRYMASQRDALNAETDLLRAKGRLKEIASKITTNKLLISQSEKIAPLWVGARLSFSIIRRDGTAFSEFPAAETSLVEPGDTIKVKCCGSGLLDSDSSAAFQTQSSQPERSSK
jgi:protein involved in polysaccharide export with SLBB domain